MYHRIREIACDRYGAKKIRLLVPAVATRQTRRIMDANAKLDQLPLRFQVYDKATWSSKGILVIPVDDYLAFYLPVEMSTRVVVLRIIYGRREIDTQFRSDDGHFSSESVILSVNAHEEDKLIQDAIEQVGAAEDHTD